MSSDGGLLVLQQVDRKLGLTEGFAQQIEDPRQPGKVVYDLVSMLRQRVYGIALGYEDCNDHDLLRSDPMFGVAIGGNLAPQPTLSEFENRVSRRDLYRLSQEMVDGFARRHRAQPPSVIVIDMDATDDPAHGQQELEFYHGYYRKHCFLPLLAFCSCDGGAEELVAAVLRPGNSHAGRRSASILKRLVQQLRAAFPAATILFRGDAGFALPEMYETCENLAISYLISLPKNARLETLARPLMDEARHEREETGQKARGFGDFLYAAGTWNQERRVIAKAEIMDQGENPRFVVTNLAGDPESLYREYCQRGDCENRIKELKLDLLSGRTSCHRFLANCFRLLLAGIAFVLLSAVRLRLAGTEFARSTMGQLRVRLLKVAAKVVRTTRRIWVLLPQSFPLRHLWDRLLPPEMLAS